MQHQHVESGFEELKSYRQWICWRLKKKASSDKFRKVPCETATYSFYAVDALDQKFHMSYKAAKTATTYFKELSGVGFVARADDPFCFLDIDDCWGKETESGTFRWVKGLIDELDSLVYLTPSGEGMRIVLKGVLPGKGGYYSFTDDEGEHVLEAYDRDHFLTFTERLADDSITDASDWLSRLKKIDPAVSRNHGVQNLPGVILEGDLQEIRNRVKTILVSHELSPEPILEGFRKNTLLSIGGHLLHDGVPQELWWRFLNEINATLLYNKEGELEGLEPDELEEIFDTNLNLKIKRASDEVQDCLDAMAEFLTLIRPRLKGAFNTDWSFLNALTNHGRKYGTWVSNHEIRVDCSWKTLQKLSRIATAKTLSKKIKRLEKGHILSRGNDSVRSDKSGYFVIDLNCLLTGEYFGLANELGSMREDSNVSGSIDNNQHSITIFGHAFWVRKYGNARGPLFAAIDQLGGGGKTRDIALKMGRVKGDGKPNSASISGLLRKCEKEGTLSNPYRGCWEFSEDFSSKLYRARTEIGEFSADKKFADQTKSIRKRYREGRHENLALLEEQRNLFYQMIEELKLIDPDKANKLEKWGAKKPETILGKYFVEGRRVTGIVGRV